MPINKNHEFEELDGVKCTIVERNATEERVAFLKDLLSYNRFTVVVVPSPPPKVAPAKPAPPSPTVAEGEANIPAPAAPPAEPPPPPHPSTFTVGVTDVMFNPTNAIFGRQLYTRNGHIVTLAYWQQKEKVSSDEVPYYERK